MEPTLFDDEHDAEDDDQTEHDDLIESVTETENEIETPAFALDPSDERDGEGRTFADEFVEDEEDKVLTAAPIIDRAVPEPVSAAEEPMFSAGEPEPDHYEAPEPARSPILPVALGVVLGMLLAFPSGYFVGSRDRLVPAAESAPAAAAQSAGAPSGAATPEKPGQYSEQKVTPPPAVSEAPPVSATPPAPAPVNAPALTPAPAEPAPPVRVSRLAGHLVVRSTPSRAAVTVNGQWRGRTPLTLDALPFGNYVVRVVQEGYDVAREEVTLTVRDASHTINARLEPKTRAGATPPPVSGAPVSGTGSLYVDSRPQGANVLLDGRNVGKTPLNLTEVPVGSYVVRIEMAGKKPWSVAQSVTAGKITRVTGSLEDR